MDQKNSIYKVRVDSHLEVELDWRNMDVDLVDGHDKEIIIRDENGQQYHAKLEQIDLQTKQISLRLNGELFQVELKDELDRRIEDMGLSVAESQVSNELKAPMPGQVKEVMVQPGQHIEEGDPLLVLVAMKMENILKSPTSGIIEAVAVQPEDIVNKNDVLIRFDQN